MPDTVTVNIKGLDELQKALEALGRDVAMKVVKDGLKAGAAPLIEEMVAQAPKDTGFLAEHFNARTKSIREDIAAVAFVGPKPNTDYPDADGTYRTKMTKAGKAKQVGSISVESVARFLEFGTTKMKKHPFITRAWEAKKGAALQAIIDTIKKALVGK
jgi:HK97 gp10 family phage protein